MPTKRQRKIRAALTESERAELLAELNLMVRCTDLNARTASALGVRVELDATSFLINHFEQFPLLRDLLF